MKYFFPTKVADGIDNCFGRSPFDYWFARDRYQNNLFHGVFFPSDLTFNLSFPDQNYTIRIGYSHYLINYHWVYAFIIKGERKVFIMDSTSKNEKVLYISEFMQAFVEVCLIIGGVVDPRSNKWTQSLIATPL